MANLRDITGNWFSDPDLVIASNQLKSVKHVNKFGHNSCIAACATEDIWDQGGTYAYPTTARIHDIASASCSDGPCGTGALTINIQGLDINYNEISEDITLNGTCNVPTTNAYLRIFRMLVLTAGSGGANAGNITATAQTDGTVSAAILAANGNQTHMAIYTVPEGKTGYISQIYGGIGRKQSASFTIDLVTRDSTVSGSVFNTKFTLDGNSTGSSSINHRPSPYIVVPSKFDIKIKANSSVGGADVIAGFDIILM